MRFWDASALLPLLIHETTTAAARALARHDPAVVVWWGTQVECASALARLEREAALSATDMSRAMEGLAQLAAAWHEIEASDLVRECAVRLVRVHPLRAADATQLAAAIVAAEMRPSSLEFVTADRRLAMAATREGFVVRSLDPSAA